MVGKRATMPAKMISEMPLPTPRLVICSPIHISSMVPPVRVITAPMRKNRPGWMTTWPWPPKCSSPMRDAVGLDHRQHHGEIAGVLVEDLAARLAFLLQRFQFGKHRGHQLDDDGGGDVGHDAQGEDRHAADRAARQGVEDVEQAAARLLHLLGQRRRVDAGHGDIGADARHDQGAQGEEDAAAQLLGLGDGAEVEIGCQLFGCGRHQAAPRNMPMIRTGRTYRASPHGADPIWGCRPALARRDGPNFMPCALRASWRIRRGASGACPARPSCCCRPSWCRSW